MSYLCAIGASKMAYALVADTSLLGARVVREPDAIIVVRAPDAIIVVRAPDAIIAVRGGPAAVVSDNGTEFTSTAILAWCQSTGVTGTPSRRESQPRTLSSRASTAGFVTRS